MIDRRPRVEDIGWFNDLLAFRRLDLDPPYQRYSVWSRSYKQYFMDTILNNFPSPAVFLHLEDSEGENVFHVVDGKQRLIAIFGFQDNEFPLSKDHSRYPGRYFDDLPLEVQAAFRRYEVPVEILITTSESDLREAFDRLNRNVRKLNSQELRHARHDGPLMNLVEKLAKERFWKEVGLATPARMRTMRDVEFVSEIFVLTAAGVQDGASRVLDEYYARYDDEEEFQEIEECQADYEACKRMMERLGTPFLRSTRFNNLHDFYSLWAALLDHIDGVDRIDYDATRSELESFSERVTDPNAIAPEDSEALKYSDAVRQGANKRTNRQERADILKGLIKTR